MKKETLGSSLGNMEWRGVNTMTTPQDEAIDELLSFHCEDHYVPNNCKECIRMFNGTIKTLLADERKQAEERGQREGRKEAVGNIGAKLLARHSPQAVLDAYFDVANEELEIIKDENEVDIYPFAF